MINSAQIDFEIHWTLNKNILYNDSKHDLLKSAKKIPYRLYLIHQDKKELLAERDFNLRDRYFVREQHYFSLDTGQYTIALEEPMELLNLEIKHFKLNSVIQPSLVWVMP